MTRPSAWWLLIALIVFILGFGAGHFSALDTTHTVPVPAPTTSFTDQQLPNGDAFNG